MYAETKKIPTAPECPNTAPNGDIRAGWPETAGTAVYIKPTLNIDKNLPAPRHHARPAMLPLFSAAGLRKTARTRSYSRMSGAGCAARAGGLFTKEKINAVQLN